jgi:hypothetical protein
MNGYELYCTYLAVKQHMTTAGYDFHKYEGSIRSSVDSFEKRRDKYYFHKLARKLNDADVVPFLVANFIENEKVWIRDLLDERAFLVYRDWQRRNQSLTYMFKEDFSKICEVNPNTLELIKVEGGNYPELLRMYMQKEVSIETMVIIHQLSGMLDKWKGRITDDVIYPKIELKIRKYMPFMSVNLDSMKNVVRTVLTAHAE